MNARIAALAAALMLAMTVGSQASEWAVLKPESKLEFAGLQMGVPTGGEFTAFTSTIAFDRDNLSASSVRVVIDLGSIATPLPLIAQILVQEPWFDIANHPQGIFEAGEFRQVTDMHYEANGMLTLRGVTLPVSFSFEFASYGKDPEQQGWLKAILLGEATMQRTAFGIGKGEWGATNIVADDVTVTVRLTAKKQIMP